MKIENPPAAQTLAFTMTEVLVGFAMVATLAIGMYSGIASGFAMVNLARQNLRATQIALEKMETVRMYSWSQINSNGFIPPSFTAPFFPPVGTNTDDGGLTYYGQTIITNTPIAATYSNDVKMAIVQITWTNRNISYRREFSTYISQYGMQRYIY